MLTHWSKILLEIRKETGFTRSELSKISGVGVSTIENYEKNKIEEPSIYKIEALLAAMGYELEAVQP
jgi:transcriptional regulator with XRE-family HTH domain